MHHALQPGPIIYTFLLYTYQKKKKKYLSIIVLKLTPTVEREKEMAAATIRCLALTMFSIIQILLLWDANIQVYAFDCQTIDGARVLIGCVQPKGRPIVKPTDLCCKALKYVGISCVCKAILKEIEQLYNMQDLVYVANYCGQPLKPGTQCGSKTPIPPKIIL